MSNAITEPTQNALFRSRCRVFKGGYRIADAQVASGANTERFLTDGLGYFQFTAQVGDELFAPYNPLEEPSLFLEFAETDISPEGVLAFANRRGLLGVPFSQEITVDGVLLRNSKGEVVEGLSLVGESLVGLAREMLLMNQLWELWAMVEARDIPGLKSRITWKGGRPWYITPKTVFPAITRKALASARSRIPVSGDLVKEGDILLPAVAFIFWHTGSRLDAARVFPRLALSPEILSEENWMATGDNALSLRYTVHTLHSALWFQFAQAIAGNKSFHPCQQCGSWFLVSPVEGERHKRNDRVYCGAPCKLKAYRRRKKGGD